MSVQLKPPCKRSPDDLPACDASGVDSIRHSDDGVDDRDRVGVASTSLGADGPIATPARRALTAATQYVVRLVPTNQIEEAVLPLWSSGMTDASIPRFERLRYEWLYGVRPGGATRTWVVEDTLSKRTIGACSLIPVRMSVLGSIVTAGLIGDLIVSREARIVGPALTLIRAVLAEYADHGLSFVYGSPNRRAWPVFQRIGTTPLCSLHCFVRPIDWQATRFEQPIRTRLRGLIPAAIANHVARTAAWAATLGFRATYGAAAAASGLLAEISSERLRYSPAHQGSMLQGWPRDETVGVDVERTGDFLGWRYGSHPTHEMLFVDAKRRGKSIGKAFVRLKDGVAEVQDASFQGRHDSPPVAFWHLLARAVREHGAHTLSVSWAGRGDLSASLKMAGFLEWPEVRNVIYHLPPDASPEMARAIAMRENWRLLAGNLDI